jgi:plastocyanin
VTPRRLPRPAARVAALTALGAVGAAAAHVAPPADAAKAKSKAKTRTVGVVSDFFDPERLTIHVGDKVKYVWKGGFAGHDVNVEAGPERFHSPTQYAGTWSHVFRKAGTYRLYCTQHEGMVQTVTVKKRR